MRGERGEHPVLVTGGAGFIGSHLVSRLLTENRQVVVLDDLSTGSLENLKTVELNPRLRIIQSRVSQCAELPSLVARSECVYHLAAAVGVERVLESPLRAIQTNLGETEAVLSAASHSKTPVLLASSSEVYGKSEKGSLSEEDDLLMGSPTHPRWSYACSKLMDEFLAIAYGQERKLPFIIARLFNTIGPRQSGQYGMVLPRFISEAKAGRPLRVYGDGRQTRCFCDVSDAVEALIRLERTPAALGQIVNVGSTHEISIRELATRVTELLESKSTVELIPYEKVCAGGFEDLPRRRPNIEKLIRLTGFQPTTPLRVTIARAAGI
jgi:UDP-glucose 4-epimerase